MNGPEKSDSPIVAVKPANEAARAAEEQAEPRGGTEANADQRPGVRTQSREAVSLAALLHHVADDVLGGRFFGLKGIGAPGDQWLTWTDLSEGLEDLLQSLQYV